MNGAALPINGYQRYGQTVRTVAPKTSVPGGRSVVKGWISRSLITVLVALAAGWGALLAQPTATEECESLLKARAFPAAIQTGRRAVHTNPTDPDAQSCLTLAYYRYERAKLSSGASADTPIESERVASRPLM